MIKETVQVYQTVSQTQRVAEAKRFPALLALSFSRFLKFNPLKFKMNERDDRYSYIGEKKFSH